MSAKLPSPRRDHTHSHTHMHTHSHTHTMATLFALVCFLPFAADQTVTTRRKSVAAEKTGHWIEREGTRRATDQLAKLSTVGGGIKRETFFFHSRLSLGGASATSTSNRQFFDRPPFVSPPPTPVWPIYLFIRPSNAGNTSPFSFLIMEHSKSRRTSMEFSGQFCLRVG